MIAAALALLMVREAPARESPCGSVASHFEPGARFAGQIRRVTGPDTVCIGRESDPATWVGVRLQEVRPRKGSGPRAAEALGRTLLEHYAVCEVTGRPGRPIAQGQVNAVCRVKGISVGAIVRKLAPDHYR